MRGKRFYAAGLRFECQGEGKCCVTRGRYGYVYLSFNDRRRLAAHFKISTAEFTARYTEKEDGLYQLKYADKDCPFMKDNRCEVYDARPWQCRTWPFWPENMKDRVGAGGRGLLSRRGQGQALFRGRDRGDPCEEERMSPAADNC